MVGWFVNSINIKEASVFPAVIDPFSNNYPNEWNVGKYHKGNVRMITIGDDGNPLFGSTVDDGAVIRGLKELKNVA